MHLVRPIATVLTYSFALTVTTQAFAGSIIYESATPIVTSATGVDGEAGVATGLMFFSGVNFHIDTTTHVTAIGGHFSSDYPLGGGQIFGAIVPVTSLTAAPASRDLSSGTVATTLITLPVHGTTATVSGSLDISLSPGFYAVLFGAGKFGAGADIEVGAVREVFGTGFTGLVNTNGVSTYVLRQSDGARISQAPGVRYFVEGTVLAEPSSATLAAAGLIGSGVFAARRIYRTSGSRA